MNKSQLTQLKNYIIKNGGATIDNHGSIKLFDRGYMVSLANYEKQTTIDRLHIATLKKYLYLASLYGLYVGFWLDDGVLYVDMSKRIENKQQAIDFGLYNKQISIYDLKNQTTIYLN